MQNTQQQIASIQQAIATLQQQHTNCNFTSAKRQITAQIKIYKKQLAFLQSK